MASQALEEIPDHQLVAESQTNLIVYTNSDPKYNNIYNLPDHQGLGGQTFACSLLRSLKDSSLHYKPDGEKNHYCFMH